MAAWLPVPKAVLGMVARCLPSPVEAQQARVDRLFPVHEHPNAAMQRILQRVRDSVASCNNSEDAPLVVYVSKMVAVPADSLPPAQASGQVEPLTASQFCARGRDDIDSEEAEAVTSLMETIPAVSTGFVSGTLLLGAHEACSFLDRRHR